MAADLLSVAASHTTKERTVKSVQNPTASGLPPVRLYFDGKIEQWWNRQDQAGVVFVVNAASIEETQRMLSGLPLPAPQLRREMEDNDKSD